MRLLYGLTATAVWIAGCYRGEADGPAPPRPPANASPSGDPAACRAQAAQLGAWVKLLDGEGHMVVSLPSETKLVVLAGVRPAQVPEAPIVHVTRRDISFQGALMADLSKQPPALGPLEAALRGVLARAPRAPVILAMDETTRWATVAAVVQAAERAGAGQVALLFTAGASQVTPPEPGPPDRRRETNLFGRCDAADKLMDRIGKSDDKPRLMIDELPRAIEACGCKVELPAVRRWLWAIWDRDQPGMPMLTVTLAVARGGAPLTMDPATPWSAAHAAVVAAARAGKPVSVK
jgi:biopolymer transport protein ExbD